MEKTSRARRATVITATAAVVAGGMAVTVVQPAVAYSAPASVNAAASAPLSVTSISPSAGVADGGTTVVLAGSGFTGIDVTNLESVTFGGVPAARIVIVSDVKLVAVSPPGTGTVDVRVTSGTGASKKVPKFGYRMALSAIFDSLPAKATGGTPIPVEVSGGSVGATAAAFAALKISALVGGQTTTVTWVDENHLKVIAPAMAGAAPATVRLVHDGYAGPVSESTVDYVPAVSSVTPGAASVAGGDSIKIGGGGFLTVDSDDPEAVTIGGVAATYFEVVSATQITAVLPAGAPGPAVVRVSTPAAASAEDGPAVSYKGPLAIDASGAQFLRAGGGSHLLTVTGGSLGDSAKEFAASGITLKMGTTKIGAAYVDATHLRVTLPVLSIESATLQLSQGTVGGPVVTLPVAPVVTGISLVTATLAGGKAVQVKVSGVGAATATDFAFGANPASCQKSGVNGTNASFTCIVPEATEAGPVWVRFTSGNGAASRFSGTATFSYTDID